MLFLTAYLVDSSQQLNGDKNGPRFVSMCIVTEPKDNFEARKPKEIVRGCLRFLCTLISTTKPLMKPLMIVNSLMSTRQRNLLRNAGATIRTVPDLPSFNKSGTAWLSRPKTSGKKHDRSRLYTFYKLYLWDPNIVGYGLRVHIDSDAIIIRNVGNLLTDYESPAALAYTKDCTSNSYNPPNGIQIDENRVEKKDFYWNTGVVVYKTSQETFQDLMKMYMTGNFPTVDLWVTEGDILQTYYWRKLKGKRPNELPHTMNFRGYDCAYSRVSNYNDISIIHKSSFESKILNKICPEYAKEYWQKLGQAMNTDSCSNYNLSIPPL